MENISENIEITPQPLSKKRGWGKFYWLKNKYFLALLTFFVWMFWFDPKDIRTEISRWAKYRDLKKSETHLISLIKSTETELLQLKTDAETIERYAREKYFMKKDNEDIFIVPPQAEK